MAVQDDIGALQRDMEVLRRRVNGLEDRLSIPRPTAPTPQIPPEPAEVAQRIVPRPAPAADKKE